MTSRNLLINIVSLTAFVLLVTSCKAPQATQVPEQKLPQTFVNSRDTVTDAALSWRQYFADPYLESLIDTALQRNQELNIALQEIQISQTEVLARKGEYLPFVGLQAGAGVEKVGEYTRPGAVEKQLDIKPETKFPEPLPDFRIGAVASWEVDVWRKLRNAKQSAVLRYLAGIEGRNFMITNLIAEIANTYYELLAQDNLLAIISQNVEIQTNALQVVKQQKQAAKVSQLAVNRFEAQLLNTKNRLYEIQQRIVEAENRLNYLIGSFPKDVPRNAAAFTNIPLDTVYAGIPSQLLVNRPDVRQAELQLKSANVDVQVARANFYPSFRITAGAGFNAFNTAYLFKPSSLLYNLAGDIVAPLVNRNAIKAAYNSANAQQVQQMYNYQQTVLNAYVEVLNQLSGVQNYRASFETKSREVELLVQSVNIANNLFTSARADYLEVLLTQREALESKVDLVEIKRQQLNAKVNIYRALGGGWR